MNNLGSCKPRPLDAMNNLGLRMIRKILGCEPMSLNVMNNLGLWMTWTTPSPEHRALDAINSLGLWLIWTTTSCELRTLDAMNSSWLWMWGPLGPIGILASSKSNSEINSTFYYKESTTPQYPMYITMKHQVLESVTHYPLYENSSWTSIHNYVTINIL